MSIEVLWEHQAGRSIWELDNVCMRGKCIICNTFKLVDD